MADLPPAVPFDPGKYFASTPTRAVLQRFTSADRPATVIRSNVAGHYATVLLRDGIVEGSPLTEAVLVERFAFGGQPLTIVDTPCVFAKRDIGPEIVVRLTHGMPPVSKSGPCARDDRRDAGSTADVEAVRRLMIGPLVPWVSVSGAYAAGHWYGAGGGGQIFRRAANGWTPIGGSGGSTGFEDLRHIGVPARDACRLGFTSPACGRTP